MVPIDSPWVTSYSTYINVNIVSVTFFEILDLQFWWPWTSTVEGHPMSKVMVSIESPYMVSDLTFICDFVFDFYWPQHRIYHHFFKIFDLWFWWSWTIGQFKIIQCQGSLYQLTAHSWFSIWPPLCLTLYFFWYSRYLMQKFCEIGLKWFKVIQGQRS